MTSANPKLINDLRAFRTRQRAVRTATNQTQARDFQRRAKKLFSKADFKTAGKIVGDLRAERNRANLEIGGSAEAKDAHDVEVGKKLNRQLGRALPGFREFQSLKRPT